jgi:multiple antibiotic resistance protein
VDTKSIISVSLILFSVIDIIGILPIIIDLKDKGKLIEPGKVSLISLAIMISFLFVGELILNLFGVDIQSFAVAGAIIMFLIGIEMVLGVDLFKEDRENKQSRKVSVVPVAFPLIAGAGTMTTIISLKAKYNDYSIVTGIVINIIIVFLVLYFSDYIKSRLKPSMVIVLRKVFGIILLAISVKLFRDNFHLLIKPIN